MTALASLTLALPLTPTSMMTAALLQATGSAVLYSTRAAPVVDRPPDGERGLPLAARSAAWDLGVVVGSGASSAGKLRRPAYGMLLWLFWHTASPMHWPGPMLPVLPAQAANPMQEPVPTAPVFSLQAKSPSQEPFPMLAPVLFPPAPTPLQEPLPSAPVFAQQASPPSQAPFPTLARVPPTQASMRTQD